MAWRVMPLSSKVDLPDGTPQAIDADAGLCVFTTADLRWQPVVSGDPDGAQIATLWGDPVDGAFGAVLRVRKNSGDVYTLVRRRDADERRWTNGKMDHEWLYWDNQDFMKQIGLAK